MRDRRDETGDENGVELDGADHALVDRLRALPPEGNEPDWKKLEAAIRAEVSTLPVPAPWWRNWRWLVPLGALATTAAIVMTIQIRRGDGDGSTTTLVMTVRDASVPQAITGEESDDDDDVSSERAAAMWLDGEPADLDDVSPEALDGLGPHDGRSTDEDSDDTMLGLLPAADYQWIDTLRDDEAARLETYLARRRP